MLSRQRQVTKLIGAINIEEFVSERGAFSADA
jgi:hypothetical protein